MLHLPMPVDHGLPVLASLNGVENDAIVVRRHHDHGERTSHDPLTPRGRHPLRPTHNADEVGVHVLEMEIRVERELDQGEAF
jgi:hypothetical protein